jgi:hypothetical protein
MMTSRSHNVNDAPQPMPAAAAGNRGDLPPAARRALEEAAERRRAAARDEARLAKEIGGRGGCEPVRYGDWEIKGRAVDF